MLINIHEIVIFRFAAPLVCFSGALRGKAMGVLGVELITFET